MKKVFIIFILPVFIVSCSLDDFNLRKFVVNDKNSKISNTDKEDVNIVVNPEIEQKRVQKVLEQDFAVSSSASKNYKKALELINSGNRVAGINVLQDLVNKFPEYKQAKITLDKLESPFSLAASIVEKYIDNWINNPSDIKPFEAKKVEFPKLPEKPVLKKGEFEKTIDFNMRVKDAQRKYQAQLDAIKSSYEEKVNAYNERVDSYNSAVDWERKSRVEKIPAMRKRYLDTAFTEVLGRPRITNLQYEADKEVFYGQIISEHNNLQLNVEIPVVISRAKEFKNNFKNLKPSVKIDLIDGNIVFSNVEIDNNGMIYPAKLISSKVEVEKNPEVTIEGKVFGKDIFNIKTAKPLKVKQIKTDNRQFFIPKI